MDKLDRVDTCDEDVTLQEKEELQYDTTYVGDDWYWKDKEANQDERSHTNVSVKLHFAKETHAEDARVDVQVNDPEELVARVLTNLCNRFSPESLVSIGINQQAQEVTANAVLVEQQEERYVGGFGDRLEAYDDSLRIGDSRIISETALGEPQVDGENVTYVEVPVIEEKLIYVSKPEVVEIEKKVVVPEYVEVERIVEVPRIEYVDKHVEVPQVVEVERVVSVKQYVDVPKEYVRHVPKIVNQVVEKIVEVPQVIEVPKPVIVENKVVVPRFKDTEVPTVVAQTVRPGIVVSDRVHPVQAHRYEPRMIPVDVYVPMPVSLPSISCRLGEQVHQVVDIPAGHYNSLVTSMNQRLEQQHRPLLQDASRHTPMLPQGMRVDIVQPISNEWSRSYQRGRLYVERSQDFTVQENVQRTASQLSTSQVGAQFQNLQNSQFAQNLQNSQFAQNLQNSQFAQNLPNTQFAQNLQTGQYSQVASTLQNTQLASNLQNSQFANNLQNVQYSQVASNLQNTQLGSRLQNTQLASHLQTQAEQFRR